MLTEDGQYVAEDRTAKVKFDETEDEYEDLTAYDLVKILVCDPDGVQKGKELFIDYGKKYQSYSSSNGEN